MSTEDFVNGSIFCLLLGVPIVAAFHTLLWQGRHWASFGAKLLVAVVWLGFGVMNFYDPGYFAVWPVFFTLASLAATAGVAELARLSWWQRPLLIVGGTLLVALPLWTFLIWREQERRAQFPTTPVGVDDHQRRTAP